MTQKFFEVIPKIGKGNESFYVRYFINNLAPQQFTNDEIIKKMENLINELKKDNAQSHVVRYLTESCEIMKRVKLTREKCEQYLENKKKWIRGNNIFSNN